MSPALLPGAPSLYPASSILRVQECWPPHQCQGYGAALLRVAAASSVSQEMRQWFQATLDTDDYLILYRQQSFYQQSIFVQMLNAVESHSVLTHIPEDLASKSSQSWIQKQLTLLNICPSAASLLLPRMRKFQPLVTRAQADRVVLALHRAPELHVPAFMITAVIKTICNSWTTTRRYRQGARGCSFGCSAIGGDCFLHYLSCPI
eukprot:9390194-Pyramimonas_sp.AAC.1